MPVDRDAVAALADEIGKFYLRDRALLRAQTAIVAALARGEPLGERVVRTYVGAVARYFSRFEREARMHLTDLERRLAKASQLQFNLTAERGVAVRRVERTQGVLARIAELAPR